MKDLKVGDTIKCVDNNDAIDAMTKLAKDGIQTDFLYEKDGKKGIWLIVEGLGKKKMNNAEYIESYNAIQTLKANGILDEEEAAVHEHNLLYKIIIAMRLEESIG